MFKIKITNHIKLITIWWTDCSTNCKVIVELEQTANKADDKILN